MKRIFFLSAIVLVSLFSLFSCDEVEKILDDVNNKPAASDSIPAADSVGITYEYVDLGLSVNWATFNVGATKPEEYGDYYAWGETDTKTDYSWYTYKWCNGSEISLTKYCNDTVYGNDGFTDTKTTLDVEDDVAYVKWGDSWRMPTKVEMDELYNNCTWKWYDRGNSEFNGVPGYKVTSNIEGYTNRFVFLPAAGSRYDTTLGSVGSGYYWSSSLGSYAMNAYYLNFDYSYVNWRLINNDSRSVGYAVRPVCPSEEWLSSVNISLVEDNKTLLVGSNALLSVIVKKNNKDYSYIPEWNSDNPSVAIVDENGVVYALSTGIAHITASVRSLSVQCTVTVIKKDESEIEHEYVDLGLSVKWATFNVGALSPEDFGSYYAWGETETKSVYTGFTYKWSDVNYIDLTKYNTDDNKTTLDPEDDVACVKWGGSWRMPTKAELDELQANCKWTWTTVNGVNGYLVTSNKTDYSDRSIFLPCARVRVNMLRSGNLSDSYGQYWSSSINLDNPYEVWYLHFYSGNHFVREDMREPGRSVRPVCP